MNSTYKFRITILAILILATISLAFKIVPATKYIDSFYADDMYNVHYRYFYKTQKGNTIVRTFIPKSNDHQRITNAKDVSDSPGSFQELNEGNNLKGVWTSTKENNYEDINYQFTFEGQTKNYDFPLNFDHNRSNYDSYLEASQHIQVNDDRIDSLANLLSTDAISDRQVIRNLFDFVYEIPSAPIISLTDAITTLEQNRASCNGKSRLLVALARKLGYPSRIKGGIILEEANKRTSHSWTEININDKWIPFDALNNHYAHLPANYLELYEGDEFMITYTSGINFDYTYEIKKQVNIPFLGISADEFGKKYPISLWGLVENDIINLQMLILLLMIPIGGLLVAFLRNVVGLKTFGVFLPVLISFSLMEIGFIKGIISFIFLILFVGLVTRPFNRLGLLHTPKLVISLSLMVLVMLAGSYIGMITNVVWLTSLSFFPTIILTVSAERFSTLIAEDGFQKATATFSQTIISVVFCYWLLSSSIVSSVIILFPEILLIVIALAMILGRYIGLRWTELFRFQPLFNLKNI